MKKILFLFLILAAPMLLGMEEKKSASPSDGRCFVCNFGSALQPSGYEECHTSLCDYCIENAEHCVQYDATAKSWSMRYFCLKCQRDVFVRRVSKKPVDK